MVSNCQLLSHASVVPSLRSVTGGGPRRQLVTCVVIHRMQLSHSHHYQESIQIWPPPGAGYQTSNMSSCGIILKFYQTVRICNIRFLSTYQKATFQHSSHLTRTCTKVSKLFKQSSNTEKHYITSITPVVHMLTSGSILIFPDYRK